MLLLHLFILRLPIVPPMRVRPYKRSKKVITKNTSKKKSVILYQSGLPPPSSPSSRPPAKGVKGLVRIGGVKGRAR